MMDINQQLITALKEFGLSQKEIQTYVALHTHPWVTVVELAQHTTIPRPTLYRLLQDLHHCGLVQTNVDHKTTYYATTSLQTFRTLIIDSEQKTNQLKTAFSQVESLLPLTRDQNHYDTEVSFFRGENGIKSLEWEMAEQKGKELLIFGSDQWWQYLGKDFAEEIRQKYVDNNIKVRELLNLDKAHLADTDWTSNQKYKSKLFEARYLSRSTLPIDNEIYVTASAVCIYSLNKSEVVAIKIINPSYVATMKALFEISWAIAEMR